jgi:hypothetical protein
LLVLAAAIGSGGSPAPHELQKFVHPEVKLPPRERGKQNA